MSDSVILQNVSPTPNGPVFSLPNRSEINATSQGIITFAAPFLSQRTLTAHVLSDLLNASLISLGQLCDDDCLEILDKRQACVPQLTLPIQSLNGIAYYRRRNLP